MKNIRLVLTSISCLFFSSNMTSIDPKTYAIRTMVAAATGVGCEVIFTALYDYAKTKDAHLKGYSYIWMLFVYAAIYPLYRLVHPNISHLNSAYRYMLYMCIIYGCEYASGTVLRKFIGSAPWEQYYHGNKWAVDDLIRLDYAPAWIVAALIFEKTCLTLEGK